MTIFLLGCLSIDLLAAPVKASGSVGFNQITTQSQSTTSTSRYIVGSVGAGSYLYQPWLVTWSTSLSVGLSTSSVGESDNKGAVYVGGLETGILPRSRFPLSIGYNVTDSALETQYEAAPNGQLSSSRATRLNVRQSYNGYGGGNISLWYNRSDWASNQNNASSTAEGLGANTAMRSSDQVLSLSASAYRTESGNAGNLSENANLSAVHSFTPQPQSGLNTSVTVVSSDVGINNAKTFSSHSTSAVSNFYWRPDYRPMSLTGGLSLRDSQVRGGSQNQNIGINLASTYAISRLLRASAGMSANMEEGGEVRTGSATLSSGINYSGDAIYIGKLVYNWGVNFSANSSVRKSAEESSNTWLLSGGFNHNIQHNWQPAVRHTISASLGQGVTESFAGEGGRQATGLSHSARLSWSENDENSTTTAWVSVTDSRRLGGGGTTTSQNTTGVVQSQVNAQQSIQASLRRTQNLNRLSMLTADLTMRANNSAMNDRLLTSAIGTAEYSHSRLFGVYQLRFRSNLALSQDSVTQGSQTRTSRWDNRVEYNIGMLSTSAMFTVVQSAKAEVRTLTFQVTRRF